jgi:hypothetical protein
LAPSKCACDKNYPSFGNILIQSLVGIEAKATVSFPKKAMVVDLGDAEVFLDIPISSDFYHLSSK